MMDESKFAEWKAAAQKHADDLKVVDGDQLWGDDDPYSLKEEASAAFEKGTDPKAFIEDIFADDLASKEHDEQQAAEALLEDGDLEDDEDDDE